MSALPAGSKVALESDARAFLEDGVAAALGIAVVRTPNARLGDVFTLRDAGGYVSRLIVGTGPDPDADPWADLLAEVRLEAREAVQDGMHAAGVVPSRLRWQHLEARRKRAERDELLALLAGVQR